MSFQQAQPVTVTVATGTELFVPTIPAVNVQRAQQVALSVGGDDQTVTVSPSG